jgi:hypothetical protein
VLALVARDGHDGLVPSAGEPWFNGGMRCSALGLAWVLACGSDPNDAGLDASSHDASLVDAATRDARSTDAAEDDGGLEVRPDAEPAVLRIGASTLAQRIHASGPTAGVLSAPAMHTETGSVIVAGIARGSWDHAPEGPSDGLGNSFVALDGTHTYAAWPTSATSVYGATAVRGGPAHVLSAPWGEGGGAGDEVTLTAVEIRGASAIEDTSFVERGPGEELTSAPVTTAGPALLVAFWWGSGGVRARGTLHVASPGDGFERIDGATGLESLSENGYIQIAVAARTVGAGAHTITWTSDGEGAQLYLVALR